MAADGDAYFFPAARAPALIGGFVFIFVNPQIHIATGEMDAEEFPLCIWRGGRSIHEL
jgi:hypothetical protein